MKVPESPRGLGLKYRKWRSGQREAIEHILKSDKRVILLEAATGIGKSLIAAGLIKTHRGSRVEKISGRSVVLTKTTSLAQQYLRDFGDFMHSALGKEHFLCVLDGNETLPVSQAPCQTGWQCPKRTACPYFVQRAEAYTAQVMVTTYAKALAADIGHRGIMICDEGHLLERQLVNAFSIRLPYDDFKKASIDIPPFGSMDEAATWATAKLALLDREAESIKEMLKGQITGERYQTGEYSANPSRQRFFDLRRLMQPLEALSRANTSALWSVEPYRTSLYFRPIWANDHAHKLFRASNRLIIQSATILDGDRLGHILGFKPGEYEYVRLPSIFPAERRPIYFWPVARLNMRSPFSEIRKLVAAIDILLDRYSKRRGIIHSVNWTLTDHIARLSRHKSRLIVQAKGRSRNQSIDNFLATPHSVLVSPSVTTGLDGKFELARFQILAKLPFENQGEQAIADRLEEDVRWYSYQCAFHIQQAAGRVMRDEADFGATIILDDSFSWFFRQNRSLFSDWFVEALIDGPPPSTKLG